MIWPDPTHQPTQPPIHHPWVGDSPQMVNLQTELKYLDSVKVYLIFGYLTWPHPSTHPTTHTPTHGWGILHRCWIFKQNWNILIRSRLTWFLVIWPDPTHQPTQPPIHPPMDGGASTDVESSNRIEISQFVLNLLNFYWNELPIVTPYSLRYK